MYPMLQKSLPSWLICNLSLCLTIAVNPALGQIVPDNTLPVNSEVTSTGNINTEINGGTAAGSNVFHSFQEFSIPTGGTPFFYNGLNIQNILTRVTGGSVSNIDGLLQEVFLARSQFSVGLGAFNATINSEAPDSRFFA